MSDVLNAQQGSLWLQRVAGQKPEYVGCTDLDDINAPQGDVTLSLCRDPVTRDFKTVGRSRAAPGAPTTSFTAWVFPEKSILDDIQRSQCGIYLYAISKLCPPDLDITGSVRGKALLNAIITNITDSNLVKRIETGEQAVKIDLSGDYPVVRWHTIKAARQDIAETTNLLDIAFCNIPTCEGACGAQKDAGTDGFAMGAAPAGSPAAFADIWKTDDSGVVWAVGPGHPFAAGEDIRSGVCFKMDPTTTRHLVAREPDAGPAEIAYSDDNDVTWTNVTVGAVNGEAAADHGALYAQDKYHIWFATNQGNVYFSEDGGVTWALQASATASGGNSLNIIHFAKGDPDHGYAVGDSGTIIETTDGGETWAAIVDPSGADNFTALHVFSQYRFIVGTNVGGIWQTWDEGANFTEQSGYPGYVATHTIQDIVFVNASTGYMILNTVAPVGRAYRTIDGGYDWETIVVPTNAGFNALAVIHENLAYVVGNAQGGSGFVGKIS